MTTLPTRQQVDAAAPLEFEARPAKRQRGVEIHLTYHGAPVAFTFAPDQALTLEQIEQSIDTLLKRDGWAAPAQPSAAGAKPKADRVKPEYNDAGDPICPTHRKPLREGRYGLYCPAKDKATDEYCSLKFKD